MNKKITLLSKTLLYFLISCNLSVWSYCAYRSYHRYKQPPKPLIDQAYYDHVYHTGEALVIIKKFYDWTKTDEPLNPQNIQQVKMGGFYALKRHLGNKLSATQLTATVQKYNLNFQADDDIETLIKEIPSQKFQEILTKITKDPVHQAHLNAAQMYSSPITENNQPKKLLNNTYQEIEEIINPTPPK